MHFTYLWSIFWLLISPPLTCRTIGEIRKAFKRVGTKLYLTQFIMSNSSKENFVSILEAKKQGKDLAIDWDLTSMPFRPKESKIKVYKNNTSAWPENPNDGDAEHWVNEPQGSWNSGKWVSDKRWCALIGQDYKDNWVYINKIQVSL